VGSNERREREKQQVRQRILEAARELFVKQGYEAVTMRQIAQKIEYTPTAIYFHFKDKEELLKELCGQDYRKLAGVFQELGRVRDPLQRLYELGLAYMDFGLQFPNHYRLMFMTPRPHPLHDQELVQKGNPVEDAYEFLRTTVSECLIWGYMRPEYKDPELISQMLWASIHGLTSLHIVLSGDKWIQWRPVRKTAEAMLDTQIRGLTTRDAGAKIHKSGVLEVVAKSSLMMKAAATKKKSGRAAKSNGKKRK
jgi:AcrR family transcriptional regulator